MLAMVHRQAAVGELDELLELPELDVEEGEEDTNDPGALSLELPELDGDDEEESSLDLPADVGLSYPDDDDSALDDDATGAIDAPATLGLTLAERTESLLGSDDERGCEDADELGIEELPEPKDPSDAEGLDDPGAELVNVELLPEMDGDDEEGEEIDVGIHIDEPADVERDATAPGDGESAADHEGGV
jgi:hypothetical protein